MRPVLSSVVLLLLAAATARAEVRQCRVTISGAFEGTVPCTVTFAAIGGEYHLGIGAGPTPQPVTAQLLADFKEVPKPGAYGFERLVRASGSATSHQRKGFIWTMAKGGPSKITGAPPVKRQGAVWLTLTATGKHPSEFHGKASLTLVSTTFVGKPEKVPVRVEIEF